MKRLVVLLLPVMFMAQSCTSFFSLSGDETSGPRGVFVSVDSGNTWEVGTVSVGADLASAAVEEIFLEANQANNVLVATNNAGLYASDSSGKTWAQLLPDFGAYSTFINPRERDEIFAAGIRNRLAGILVSRDRGGSWVQIYNQPQGQAAVTSLVYDPRNTSTFYAGLSTGTVLKSTDSGINWNALTDFRDRIEEVVATGDALYVLGHAQGLRRSADGGRTWTEIAIVSTSPANNLGDESIDKYNDIFIDPKNRSIIYIATGKGLFRSDNAGTSWSKLSVPVTPELTDVSAVSVNPDNSRQIFTAIAFTIYRSDDNGQTWRTTILPTRRVVNAIVIDPSEPNRVYAGLR